MLIICIAGLAIILILNMFITNRIVMRPLEKAAKTLEQATELLHDRSASLANIGTDLVEISSEQSKSVYMVTEVVEEITRTIELNTKNTDQSSQLSAESRAAAEEGLNMVIEMKKAISEIVGSNSESIKQMHDGGEQFKSIMRSIDR